MSGVVMGSTMPEERTLKRTPRRGKPQAHPLFVQVGDAPLRLSTRWG